MNKKNKKNNTFTIFCFCFAANIEAQITIPERNFGAVPSTHQQTQPTADHACQQGITHRIQ